MLMPGRKYSAESSYRYGFNGKENDNEVKGEGNQQDYGMRVYDPRLGRFLSVDPLSADYPYLTPYQFASNTPIQAMDLDGAEAKSKVLDMAKRLTYIFYGRIQKLKDQISKTDDQEIKKNLEAQLRQNQDAATKVILFRYKNRQSDEEVLLEHIFDAWDKAGPIIELTPVGDIYTVLTGKNFKGDEKSRILAGVSILPWAKLGFAGKSIWKLVNKASMGTGKEILEAVAKKVENYKALDTKHIKAAVGDILGKPVVIDGKTYDHLTEVKNDLQGLKNQIEKLNSAIDSGKITGDYLEAAQEIRSKLSKQRDAIMDVLNRAKNKSNELK